MIYSKRKGNYMRVYADNAATTKMSRASIEAMNDAVENCWGNPSSLHSIGQHAAERLQKAREDIAEVLGCSPKEIYFTSGGSEADNQAIISAARIGERKGKKHIVSTAFEHHAVLHTLKKLEKEGFEIDLLDVKSNANITPEQVKNAIRDDTCLVTVMYANNEVGSILPIAEIGKICREKGVIFHTDAVQAAGHLHINVADECIDMLSLSAHKFHGPKRAGTENLPAIIGMAAALKEADENLDANAAKMTKLRDKLIDGLSKIPHSALNGTRENRLPGNVNFLFEGIEGESLLLLLDDRGICASSGSACTSGSLDPSHVLLAIGRPHEIAHGSLRLSLSEWNTEEEIDYMLEQIPQVVTYLRNMSPLWREKVSGEKEFEI